MTIPENSHLLMVSWMNGGEGGELAEESITGAPPGTHNFLMEKIGKTGDPGVDGEEDGEEDGGLQEFHEFHGVVVREDGRLDRMMTAHAIYIAQAEIDQNASSNWGVIHHVRVERIEWDPGTSRFHVMTGS